MLRSGDIDECQTRNESNPDNLSTLSYPKNENLKKDCRNEIPQKDPIITKNVGAGDNKVCVSIYFTYILYLDILLPFIFNYHFFSEKFRISKIGRRSNFMFIS